jgi:prepilin-type N-terminal cleavage/methylation domain-containing protein
MKKKVRGFTAIELILVLGIIVILSTVTLIGLSGRKNKTELDGVTKQMASLLREAQSRSVSQSSSTGWGVRFANPTSTTPFYALFAGSSYATSSERGRYVLPSDIAYVTSTVARGAVLDTTFIQISGAASSSISVAISLISQPAASSTINVSAAGAISY